MTGPANVSGWGAFAPRDFGWPTSRPSIYQGANASEVPRKSLVTGVTAYAVRCDVDGATDAPHRTPTTEHTMTMAFAGLRQPSSPT